MSDTRGLRPLDPTEQGVEGELRQDRFLGDRDLTRWVTPVGRILARVVQRIMRVRARTPPSSSRCWSASRSPWASPRSPRRSTTT
jgi:hypothetical protein